MREVSNRDEAPAKTRTTHSRQSGLSRRQHSRRAALLLTLAGLAAIVPAIGLYLNPTLSMLLLWLLLAVASLPAIGWGTWHLAKSRGYSTRLGCWLCIVGYALSGFLGTSSSHPLAFGIGLLFMVLLPTVVLLALPKKSRGDHSRKRSFAGMD